MNLRLILLFLGTSLFSLLTSGCHKIVVNPQDPSGGPGPVLVSAYPSYITVPVTVPLSDVAKTVNQVVPPHLQDTHHIFWNKPVPHVHWHGFHTSITVDHQPIEIAHIDWHVDRAAFTLTGSGDSIHVHVPFSGGAKLIPSAASADAGGTVDGSSTLAVTPDYGFNPVIGLSVNLDHADVLKDISIKGLVQGGINDELNKIKGDFGPAVAKEVDLRGRAQKLWSNIPGAVQVPGTTDLWISLDPQGIALDGPHAANDVVTATLGAKLQMRTFLQPNAPTSLARVGLPNISAVPPDKKFHLGLPIEILPSELNRQLSTLIQDKSVQDVDFSQELGADEHAIIKSVTVLPYGNRLYLKVGFVGVGGKVMKNVRGTLIFVAHPILSVDKQTLSFDGIDYSAETSATLKGLGLEALLTVGRPIITGILQKKLIIQFAKPLVDATAKANAQVAKFKLPNPLTFKFNLEKVTPEDLLVYGNKIYLGFSASGTASVTY